ncbi:hypothetical protein [Deinococcus rufus]|uniref:Uncharacterized protein n=1 Tax=Deinococcus rufus TaxID=2136097 RepID=A0ABV7ZB25_9DEIO
MVPRVVTAKPSPTTSALAIGVALVVGIAVAGPSSGGVLNPRRGAAHEQAVTGRGRAECGPRAGPPVGRCRGRLARPRLDSGGS